MKTTMNFLTLIALALITTLSFTQCQKDLESQEMHNYALNQEAGYHTGGIVPGTANNATSNDVCSCLSANFSIEDLNEAEEAAILFMREEEKLARDVYTYLYEKWNYPVFNNITRSENRHMESLLCLIQRYGLEDPVGENGLGVFVNEELGNMYQALTEAGSASLSEALRVGATIEDLDINDLITLAEGGDIDNEDILAVFGDLTKGSRNHLRAFVKSLNQYGEAYTPQFLNAEYYAQIISSDRERGGGICAGTIDCPNNGTGNNGECLYDGTCTQVCTGAPTGNTYHPGNGQGKGKKGGPN